VTNGNAEYIPAYEVQCPGVVVSRWVPMDPELWRIENYEDFLAFPQRSLRAATRGAAGRLASGISCKSRKPSPGLEPGTASLPFSSEVGSKGKRGEPQARKPRRKQKSANDE
jgi:hypothetical protein